jgi:hypothetical protein
VGDIVPVGEVVALKPRAEADDLAQGDVDPVQNRGACATSSLEPVFGIASCLMSLICIGA